MVPTNQIAAGVIIRKVLPLYLKTASPAIRLFYVQEACALRCCRAAHSGGTKLR